jgi:predicted PurR-regulated permease PerM
MNKSFIIVLAVLVSVLIYFLSPILTPFLVGALLAYLVNPIVVQLIRLRMPRIAAVGIVFLILFLSITLLILLLIPLIQTQIERLMEVLPGIVSWIQTMVETHLKEYVGAGQIINVASLKTHISENWTKAGGMASWLFSTIIHSGFELLHWFLNLILIAVVTFYLLYDWDKLVDGLRSLLPRHYVKTVTNLVVECNHVLGAFFRGQLLVMAVLGIFYSIGLTLLGLQLGLMIGILVGLLSIVPYLGIIIGIVAASIAAFIQFGSFVAILPVWILFAVGQTLDGMFITPKLVGGRIGLHPVAVIFAVLAGATLFGFFGVLLALPVAAVSMVVIRFVNQRYRNSKLYQ